MHFDLQLMNLILNVQIRRTEVLSCGCLAEVTLEASNALLESLHAASYQM